MKEFALNESQFYSTCFNKALTFIFNEKVIPRFFKNDQKNNVEHSILLNSRFQILQANFFPYNALTGKNNDKLMTSY